MLFFIVCKKNAFHYEQSPIFVSEHSPNMSYTMSIMGKIVVSMCHCQDKIKVTLPFSRYMDLGLTRPILSSSLVVTSGLTCIRLDIIKVVCTCIQLCVYWFLFDPLPTANLLHATPPKSRSGCDGCSRVCRPLSCTWNLFAWHRPWHGALFYL